MFSSICRRYSCIAQLVLMGFPSADVPAVNKMPHDEHRK